MASSSSIRITEVGPRDGLQNEAVAISTDAKVAFIDLLSETGVAEIEVSSFVSPKWIPQLGDAADVFRRIQRKPGVVYSALIPNEKGMDAAMDLEKLAPQKIAVFTAASETFSRKNTNASIAETLDRFKPVIAKAKSARLPVRGYISCVIACPYEGPIDPKKVRDLTARLLELGVDEIDLGDTIGVALPVDIESLYRALEGLQEPGQTTLHLHDTRGKALDCAQRAVELGVRNFDSSCAGLGGCPYAPGSPGNLATESLVRMLQKMDYSTGVVGQKLAAAAEFIRNVLTPASR